MYSDLLLFENCVCADTSEEFEELLIHRAVAAVLARHNTARVCAVYGVSTSGPSNESCSTLRAGTSSATGDIRKALRPGAILLDGYGYCYVQEQSVKRPCNFGDLDRSQDTHRLSVRSGSRSAFC